MGVPGDSHLLHLSPYVPVARLTLPRQRLDSDEQLVFADVLRCNPWHNRPEFPGSPTPRSPEAPAAGTRSAP